MPTFQRVARTARRFLRRMRKAGASRSVTAMTREGVYFILILLFVFAASLFGDVNLLVVVAGMFVGILVLNWRLVVLTLTRLQLRRRFPSRVYAGEQLAVQVDLANQRRRGGSWAVNVHEQIEYESRSGNQAIKPPVLFFSYVPAGQSRFRVYRARLPQRGRYRFARPSVSTRYPFGLCRRTVVLGEEQSLIVYPRLGRLMPRWIARHHESFEGASRREQRHGSIAGEFYGVRPWRRGDSRRHIHWRSSARLGTLVVRQFEQHRNRDVAILVDLWQPADAAAEHVESVELAVSFAATVVADTCRRGGGTLLVGTTASPSDLIRGPASPALMDGALESLAVAEASHEENLAGLAESAMPWLEGGMELVLVTTRQIDPADPAQFGAIAGHPGWRSVAGRMRVVNAADADDLATYFQVE